MLCHFLRGNKNSQIVMTTNLSLNVPDLEHDISKQVLMNHKNDSSQGINRVNNQKFSKSEFQTKFIILGKNCCLKFWVTKNLDFLGINP